MANVREANECLKKYVSTKKEVTDALWDLINDCGDVLLKYIEDKRFATRVQVCGRFFIIGTGIASICLVATPAGAVSGIAGLVIGYVVVGVGKYLAITATKDREEGLKKIHKKLLQQVAKFEGAYKEVQQNVTSLAPYDERVNFNENIDKIEDVIKEAEKKNNERYRELRTFISKIAELIEKLDSSEKSFEEVFKMIIKPICSSLSAVSASNLNKVKALEAVSGGTSLVVDVAREVLGQTALLSWFEVFQGISVVVNGFFLLNDLDDLRNLNEDLKKLKRIGDGESGQVFEKYNREQTMRDQIKEIRDTILQM